MLCLHLLRRQIPGQMRAAAATAQGPLSAPTSSLHLLRRGSRAALAIVQFLLLLRQHLDHPALCLRRLRSLGLAAAAAIPAAVKALPEVHCWRIMLCRLRLRSVEMQLPLAPALDAKVQV